MLKAFLSEVNIKKHQEYLKTQRLLYSVLEKSYPRLSGLDIQEINRLSISSDIKKEAIDGKINIRLHELFFSSFSEKRVRCPEVSRTYGSEANFLYEIEKMLSDKKESGFLVIYIAKGDVGFYYGKRYLNLFLKAKPVLAIDLFEHAYYGDYGFDRKKYINTALSYLDLSKIGDFLKSD